MTDFQKRIVDFLARQPTRSASTWLIAQHAFPEKWAKRASHGALIGHIRRAGSEVAHYHPAETYPGDGWFSLKT